MYTSQSKKKKKIETNSSIETNSKEVLLGITVDQNLKFDDHVNGLCKKVCQKLNALASFVPYINVEKRRIIMKVFIVSQYRCSPLVWIFYSRDINNKINRIHEKVLRITYRHKSSSFQDLFDKDNSVTIHHKNSRTFAIEKFKVLYGPSPHLLNEVLVERNCNCNLRGNNFLIR